MVEKLKVVWDKVALKEFEKQYRYIKEDSLQSAEKVKKEILKITNELPKNPTRDPLDKFRKNNDGSNRAFEKFSLLVAYQITEKEIRILRFRHTSKLPIKY